LYTKLEVIRNNHRFTYHFEIDPTLLENDYKIPPLLLQPYIENAIVHGLRNKEDESGLLTLQIKKLGEQIRICIEDNGIGRMAAAQINEANRIPHQALGMKVTGKRIALLQQVNPGAVEIRVQDLDPGTHTGTRVIIVLPAQLKFQ